MPKDYKRTRAQTNADRGWDLGEVNPTRKAKPKPQAKVTTPATRATNSTPKTQGTVAQSKAMGSVSQAKATTPRMATTSTPSSVTSTGAVRASTKTGSVRASGKTNPVSTATSNNTRGGTSRTARKYTTAGKNVNSVGQSLRDFAARVHRWGQSDDWRKF